VALAGCDGRIEGAQKAIRADLVDPDSAKWRQLKIVDRKTDGGGVVSVVCGQINSRNNLGGMVGFSDFAYVARHDYPSPVPAGATKILQGGAYDLADMPRDNVAARRNLDVDPFPRFDDRGTSTISALCSKTTATLPSGLIDFAWANPCSNVFVDSASLTYHSPGPGGIGSEAWVLRQTATDFATVPTEAVCRILVENYDKVSAAEEGDGDIASRARSGGNKPPGAQDVAVLADGIRRGREAAAMKNRYFPD
jgi:hypothetical protein